MGGVSISLTSVGVMGSILTQRNFTFSGSLKRGFLVSDDIYPHVTSTTTGSGSCKILRIKPNVKILADRLSGHTGGIISMRLSGQLLPILRRALYSYGGIRVMGSSVLGLSLGGLVSRGLTSYDRIAIYTGLPCCVASPMVVGLLSRRLPLGGVIIVIRGRTTSEFYTRINNGGSNTMAMNIGCCTSTELLFPIPERDFVPDPGISDTIVRLALLSNGEIAPGDRGIFFGAIGTTFSVHHGATMGNLSNKLYVSGRTTTTTVRHTKLSPAIETRGLSVRRLSQLSSRVKGRLG